MVKLKKLITYLYEHNLVRYLFVGGTTFVFDVGLLVLLHGKFKLSLTLSGTISYWSSIIYNFSLNRWWTFNAGENKKLHEHLLRYGMLLIVNYVFTIAFLWTASHYINYALSKTIAVILQTSWTYPIYKNYIFGSKHMSKVTDSIT